MQVSSWLTCLWPGLPRLWWRGDWRALMTALAFAVVVDSWVVSRFLWPELLPTRLVTVGGLAALAFWLVSVWQGRRSLGDILGAVGDRAPEDLFIQAQREYLQKHWLEAEHLLQELIWKHPRDEDAQLMLATLFRRTGRLAEAGERLDTLERQDGAVRWAPEIASERRLLQRQEANDDGDGEVGAEHPASSRSQQACEASKVVAGAGVESSAPLAATG